MPGLSLFSPDFFQRKELHQKLSQHDLLLEQLGEKQRSLQVPKRFGKIAGVNDFWVLVDVHISYLLEHIMYIASLSSIISNMYYMIHLWDNSCYLSKNV